MPRRARQLPLFSRHPGGRPKKKDAGMPHAPRPAHKDRFPLHITLRIKDHVWQLRSARMFRAVRRCVPPARERFGFRLVHYSVQGNHAHFIAEAEDARALARGVQGLAIRLAKAMNRVMEKRGKVFADRYHARELRTPREVRNALLYVLNNARKHMAEYGRPPGPLWLDPYSSAPHFAGWADAPGPVSNGAAHGPPGAAAKTWLLQTGWKRRGLLSVSELPGPG